MNLGSIILGDLVSLAERGTYQGILILVWALAGAIGPTIVRGPSERAWICLSLTVLVRSEGWLAGSRCDLAMAVLYVSYLQLLPRELIGMFSLDLNLPLAGIAFALVAVFLRVKIPEGSMRDKLARVDWV